MKINISVFFILITLNIASQSFFNSYKKGKLYLRDSTELKGLIKITFGDKVKFKETEDAEKQIFDYRNVKRLKFNSGDEYFYKLTFKGKSIILIKRQTKGKLNLFSYVGQTPTLSTGTVIMGGGSYTAYYVGLEDSDYIEKLFNNPTKKKFFKVLSKYTSDCPDFLNKIKNKKSIEDFFGNEKSNLSDDLRIENIINNYNYHCN